MQAQLFELGKLQKDLGKKEKKAVIRGKASNQ